MAEVLTAAWLGCRSARRSRLRSCQPRALAARRGLPRTRRMDVEMRIVKRVTDVREQIIVQRSLQRTIGFVPTMGAFHEGHLSLMRRARQSCGFVVVSVFVNPAQFGPGEDFERYPRTLQDDCAKAEQVGVDLLFAPEAAELYPEGFSTYVDPGKIGEILEGEHRPGHFRGVATIVAKLLNIVTPDQVFLGLKDYQQLAVVRNLVRDLDMPVQTVPMPTVRENDGLAMSSRNVYLSPEERRAAVVLRRALREAGKLFENGEESVAALEMAMRRILDSEPLARVDYAVVLDAETLEAIYTLSSRAVALVAVRIGETRLIDNLALGKT